MRTRIEVRRFRRTSTLIEKNSPTKELEKGRILLTREIALPVGKALPDVLRLEFLSRRAVLIIGLQSANNNSSLGLVEEFGTVGEVLDDPEGHKPRHNGHKTFQNKDPRPARFPAHSIHLRDCGLSGVG